MSKEASMGSSEREFETFMRNDPLAPYAPPGPSRDAYLRVWQAARRAQASAEPWQEYAQHLEWCRTCAEDGVDSCHDGAQLKEAAVAAPQQAPLTAEQVRAVVTEAGFDWPKATHGEKAAFISGLRHGEAAHGISAAKETR